MNQITIAGVPDQGMISTPVGGANRSDSIIAFLARAVRDPAIDVTKLESLLRMQREILADAARRKFIRAMAAAQAEMTPVWRNRKNDQTNSRFADLEAIDEAIRPIYTKHGFCLTFDSEPAAADDDICVICRVFHCDDGNTESDGHTETYRLPAPLDTVGPKGTGNKTPLHGLGSSISYLRRYLTCMIFNVILTNEDTDGNRRRAAVSNDNRYITEDQTRHLFVLMERGRIREQQVIAKMAPGLRSIADLETRDFPRVRNALLSRINVQIQREAAEGAQL